MNKRKLPPDVLLQVDILKGAGQTPSVNKLKNISSQFINLKKASEKGTSIHLKGDKKKRKIKTTPQSSNHLQNTF